jgi:RNA polymerase sigma factor (sigma-70 family)
VLQRRLPASCAEDVTQEVLLRFLKLRHRLRDADEGQRFAWLRAITRNVAVDAARLQRRSRAADAKGPRTGRVLPSRDENGEVPATPEELVPSPDPGPVAEAIAEELRHAFVRALDRLPATYREEVACWLLLGETRSGIARRLGRSRSGIARDFTAFSAILAKVFSGFAD